MTTYLSYNPAIQLAHRFHFHDIAGRLQAWLAKHRADRVERNATARLDNERTSRPPMSSHPTVIAVNILTGGPGAGFSRGRFRH